MITRFIGIAGLCVCSFAALADENTLNGLSILGYTISKQIDGSVCSVTMKLDQKKLLENFETLQKLGIFNEDLPKSTATEKPYTVSMAFILQSLPVVTRNFYEANESADRCSFKQEIAIVDDYGNDAKLRVVDYKFNRTLYKKINWDRFESTKVIKVFPSFNMSTEVGAKLMEEKIDNVRIVTCTDATLL